MNYNKLRKATLQNILITDHAIDRWTERSINTDIKKAIGVAAKLNLQIKKNEQVLLHIEGTTDVFIFRLKKGQIALVTVLDACNSVKGRKTSINITGNHKTDEENILIWMKDKKAIHKKEEKLNDIFFSHTPNGETREIRRFSNRASL